MTTLTLRKGYVDTAEGQLHYRSAGAGPPLLLLHQAPLCGAEWEGVMAQLAPQFHVVAPDMIGHGESCDPPRECTMADFTRSTLALMDGLGLERTAIAGNHSGAALALSIALEAPARVSCLALSCEVLVTPQQIAAFVEALRSKPLSRDLPMTADGRFLAEAWERYRALAPTAALATRFRAFVIGQAARQRPFDAHHGVLHWLAQAQHVQRATCPVLIFGAEHDLFFDAARLREAEQTLPDCRSAVIANAGALSTFEQPEALAALLREFVQARGT